MVRKVLLGIFGLGALAALAVGLYLMFVQEAKPLDEAVRAKAKGQFLALSHGFVHYELQGPDTGKTIVFVHGAGSGYYAWDKNYDFFVRQGFRVLRYDLYGRGLSDRPNVVYDSVLFDTQLQELLQKLQVPPPYHLVGVSMGASVVMHFVQKRKEQIASMTLVDPASLSDGNVAWFLKVPFLSHLMMALYWQPRTVEKQMAEFYDPTKAPEYRTLLKEQLAYKGLIRAMGSTWKHMLTLNMTATMEAIGKSKVPVLTIWGNNDRLVPPSVANWYVKAMPQTTNIVLDSAGHLSNYEQPTAFNQALLTFVRNEK